jgi:type VI secretion system protein ImpL
MGRGIGFSSVFLRSLSQADTITQALFLKRSTEPSFSFYIQPVPVAGVEEMTIDVNGQEYRYRNEPEEWRRFNWPGEDSVIGARLYAVSHPKKQAAELEHEGVWGLFHLLSQARFIKQGGTQYLTEWDLRDKSGHPLAVKMRMKADKQSHVLDPRLLTEFKLPDKIRGK